MTREELIRKVKVKLDEVSPFERDESNVIALEYPNESDVKPIWTLIDETLNDACNDALMLIPLYRIKPFQFADQRVFITGGKNYYNGFLKLPDDFLRLHSFKLQDWSREVSTAISTQNPNYTLQGNEFTKGKPCKPVCVIDEHTGVGATLDFYSTSVKSPVVQKALYVARFDDSDIQENLTDFFAVMTALKITDYLGEFNKSKALTQQFENLIKMSAI